MVLLLKVVSIAWLMVEPSVALLMVGFVGLVLDMILTSRKILKVEENKTASTRILVENNNETAFCRW